MAQERNDNETDIEASGEIVDHQFTRGSTIVLRKRPSITAWGDWGDGTVISSQKSAYEKPKRLTKRSSSIMKMQSWWRMKQARAAYHKRRRSLHIGTFAIGLLIRLPILVYLIAMLCSTAPFVINEQNAETTSSPANAENMESSVLYELLKTESAGKKIIVACRCGFEV